MEANMYAFRERVNLDCRDNQILNSIAQKIEDLEDTIVGAVSLVSLSPITYVAVELGRNVPDHEIKPTVCEVEGECFGKIYEPKFSKNVWLRPRTWIVTPMLNGGFNIRRRVN